MSQQKITRPKQRSMLIALPPPFPSKSSSFPNPPAIKSKYDLHSLQSRKKTYSYKSPLPS